jgi:hypothetical protein
MLFAEPTVYFCPACMKPMLKTNYMSYTVHNSDTWSDGTRTGYPHFTPNLAKCPYCSAIFFLHNQWPKNEDVPYEESKFYKYVADPGFTDYIKAVQQGLAKDEDEEIEVRTCLWRALNKKNINDDEMKLRQENCEKLLPLNELKLSKIMQKANPDVINNLRLEIAEQKRNLGLFDECLKTFEDLPASYNWLKKQFAQKCKDRDTMVFKIKDRDENPDGEDEPLILIEDQWDIIQNSAGGFLFCIGEREGEPVEPEILYSGGKNALLRRRPDQSILLKDVHKDARESILKIKEAIIVEVNSPDKKNTAADSGALREYTAKLRRVFEKLEFCKGEEL